MLGVALLVVAWIGGTTPFGAPDEQWHYIRAVGITNGQILGPKVPYLQVPLPADQRAWTDNNTRGVVVPARLNPPGEPCQNGKPNLRGSCLEPTTSGNYPPLPYLLPAVGIGLSRHTSTAIWVARVASSLPSIALLLLAVALLWDGTGWSLLGLLAATSPMVFWISSVLNPSGMDITACLAFAAAVIRIGRTPAEVPRWVWSALLISGVIAILAGPIGLEFVVVYLLALGALFGRSALRQFRATHERWALPMSGVLGGAAILALIYTRVAGFSTTFRISPLGHGLHEGINVLPGVLKGAVGIFGALTVFLPLSAYWIWWLVVLGLVAAAMWLGDRRDRVVVASVTLLALAFPLFFYAWSERFTGFPLQGREVLPVLQLIPLVAGEVVYRRRSTFAAGRLAQLALGAVLAGFAAFQGYAWWENARFVAGAPRTIRFYAHATWHPPGGWLPWLMLAALGTVVLLLFASTEGIKGLTLQPAWAHPRPRKMLMAGGRASGRAKPPQR